MKKAVLLEAITNTVLDRSMVLAPAGATVTILEENGNVYEVAYYDGDSPSTTFYVQANQVRVTNE